MSRRRRKDRLYEKRGRFYADLRDFSEVGGGLEAMKPEESRYATDDRDEATKLLAARTKELEVLRDGGRASVATDPRLADYAIRHLRLKADLKRPATVERSERALRMVLGYFGEDVRLSGISVAGLADYVSHRRRSQGVKAGTTIQAQTILHELNALSSLYKRAVAEKEAIDNPVRLMPEKPEVDRPEAEWLEIGEAARLLSVAGTMDQRPHPRAVPYLRPILATALLSSARKAEVLGLQTQDVDFDRGLLHIRPNSWRLLKTKKSTRSVTLWPQLEQILGRYIEEFERTDGLLFPAKNGGMLDDLRGSLAAALGGAEIEKNVTFTTLRHTYAATRIQTLDHGAPVSLYTVASEMGHQGVNLIEQTYGHLQSDRHRVDVVEYREADVVRLPVRRAEGA